MTCAGRTGAEFGRVAVRGGPAAMLLDAVVGPAVNVMIARAPDDFSDWSLLLDLLLAAFAGMAGRIDPPSSVLGLTPATLAEKARRR